MKIVLTDRTYDGDVKYEIEDGRLGSDLSLAFEYLDNYQKLIKSQLDMVVPAVQIVLQAKVNKISTLREKYKDFIKFVNYIDSEENGF